MDIKEAIQRLELEKNNFENIQNACINILNNKYDSFDVEIIDFYFDIKDTFMKIQKENNMFEYYKKIENEMDLDKKRILEENLEKYQKIVKDINIFIDFIEGIDKNEIRINKTLNIINNYYKKIEDTLLKLDDVVPLTDDFIDVLLNSLTPFYYKENLSPSLIDENLIVEGLRAANNELFNSYLMLYDKKVNEKTFKPDNNVLESYEIKKTEEEKNMTYMDDMLKEILKNRS